MLLLQCLQLGLKLERVHRVVCFRQMRFAKPFLDFMTQKRSQSRSKLEENQCKNIANQLYGKSIERYVHVRIFGAHFFGAHFFGAHFFGAHFLQPTFCMFPNKKLILELKTASLYISSRAIEDSIGTKLVLDTEVLK